MFQMGVYVGKFWDLFPRLSSLPLALRKMKSVVSFLLLPFVRFPSPRGAWGETMQRQWHRIWEIPLKRFFIVKGSFGGFIGLGKLSCCWNDFGWYFLNWRSLLSCCEWREVPVISYLAFGPLTGCFGQFSYSLWGRAMVQAKQVHENSLLNEICNLKVTIRFERKGDHHHKTIELFDNTNAIEISFYLNNLLNIFK